MIDLIEQDFDNQYNIFQQQHKDFVNHTNNQIISVQNQILQLQQQQGEFFKLITLKWTIIKFFFIFLVMKQHTNLPPPSLMPSMSIPPPSLMSLNNHNANMQSNQHASNNNNQPPPSPSNKSQPQPLMSLMSINPFGNDF